MVAEYVGCGGFYSIVYNACCVSVCGWVREVLDCGCTYID